MLTGVRLWAMCVLFSVPLLVLPVASQQGATHTVEITGLKFMPEVVRVRVGDTVAFVNMDVVPHTVTQEPAGWDSGTLAKDQRWSVRVDKAGMSEYFCRFHPTMKGKIEAQ